MLPIKIWNYFKGYVIIRIEGLTLERLLNLALVNNIYLWDVKRINNIEIEVTLSIQGFKELKKLVKKVGCKVEIKEKRGLPFLLERLKKRKMLGIGFLIFWSVLIFLTSFIWKIEIIGAEQTPKEKIVNLLEDNNIKPGKFKKSISSDHIKTIMFNEFDYLSFLDVRIKGVKLVLEIKEQDLAPEKSDKNFPAHLIAKKKGVIEKIIAKNGMTLVTPGEIVNEGQILISGYVENPNTSTGYLVHAEGETLARTRYSSTIETPIIKKEKKETGKIHKQIGLKYKDKGITIIKGEIPYENFIEVIKEKKILNLDFINIDIPFRIVNYEYREVELIQVKQNLDFLKKSSQLLAIEEINKQLPKDAEILSKNSIYTIDDNILKTQVVIEVIEDIGKIQIISN